MSKEPPRCQTCGLTDEQYLNSALACRDPWHADNHLRRNPTLVPPMTSTHTYAELGLSKAAYDEIRDKLKAAGYDHAFMHDGAIDMHGIGVTAETDDVDQLALDAACAVMKALTDSHDLFPKQKAAVQVIIREAIRKCQTTK